MRLIISTSNIYNNICECPNDTSSHIKLHHITSHHNDIVSVLSIELYRLMLFIANKCYDCDWGKNWSKLKISLISCMLYSLTIEEQEI